MFLPPFLPPFFALPITRTQADSAAGLVAKNNARVEASQAHLLDTIRSLVAGKSAGQLHMNLCCLPVDATGPATCRLGPFVKSQQEV